MANYTRGTSANIIVGAAALFAFENGEMTDADLPTSATAVSYKTTLATTPTSATLVILQTVSN
jgi:hypothetical protein